MNLSRLDEIPDKIGLLASDGKVTANRTILRLVSSPVHTKLLENPDLTILDRSIVFCLPVVLPTKYFA